MFGHCTFTHLAAAATTAIALLAMSSVHAASFLDKPSVVTYWGQNSKGSSDSQKSLASYCDNNSDVLIMSFVLDFNDGSLPMLNLANGCNGPTFSGTELLQCTGVAADIKTCQDKGKTILISLGGANGVYGFANDANAEAFADTLWNIFGAGESDTRPFGDAVIDGFDLDIEGGGSTGYVAMIKRLRKHFATDSSKEYYITGAPQCPYPDAMLGTILDAVEFDAVNVQFYNNYCSTTSSSFNFDTWNTWAKSSPNSKVKVFLGVPGSDTAAGSGYVAFDSLEPIVKELQSTYSNFGGVTLWDASASYANTDVSPNYQAGVADLVHGLSGDDGDDETSTSATKKHTTKSHHKTTSKTKHHKTTQASHRSSVSTTRSILNTSKATRTKPSKSTSASSTAAKSTFSKTKTSNHSKYTHRRTTTKTKSKTTSKATKSKIIKSKTIKSTSIDRSSTKSKSTTTKAKPTKTLTSTSESNTASPISCVLNDSKCSTEGQIVCSGDSFATCNHGRWKLRQCPSSLTCFSTTDGTSVYCGQGTSGTTCPAFKSNLLVEATSLSADSKQTSFVGPTAKPYKNGRVIAQFSVTKSDAGSFEAVINARRLDQKSFGNTVVVSFKVADNIKITSVAGGTVSQTGNQVKIQYKNGSKKTMVAIVGIEGKVSTDNVLVAPNVNSMKFSS
ncbi:hypothetical protein HMPREF1544_11800 [Mucor circinelloides 1006PhL]|uniref:chitinase n=1 Tax=Mucor circinelloides f. circinelloides (strain 1006PhL) TaxID=1220926 RepID=S2IV10_MUCC1|nr:hypothetical protein HMPREF1544_11800 [Mucor circinelloides 1006PhL]